MAYTPSFKNFETGHLSRYSYGAGNLLNVPGESGARVSGGGGVEFVANLMEGGQLGYGYKAGLFDAATPLVFPPATIVVMQTPMFWDERHLHDGWALARTTKAMFETQAKTVNGIDVNYQLDSGDQPLGHDGQTFKVPTQSKRTEVSPSFTWPEVTGNLVWNIILRWIWDIQDPDTNAGMEFMDEPLPFTMSAYSLTFMAIQFDQTQHPDRIIDAAIYCNVYPQATGELGLQRTIGTSEVKERSVTFNAYLMHNKFTKQLGKEVARRLNLRSETYLVASPNIQQVSEDFGNGVAEEAGNAGIAHDRFNAMTDNQSVTRSWNRAVSATT